MPHARAAEAVGLALSVQPHVGVGMSDALGCLGALSPLGIKVGTQGSGEKGLC